MTTFVYKQWRSLVFVAAGLAILAPELAAKEAMTSSVQVTFPIGDVSIRFVESREGMVLLAKSQSISVQGRRLHFGDGKNAVSYAATKGGIQTPNGIINAAALKIANGTRMAVPNEKLKSWGKTRGEVYIHVPNLKFGPPTKGKKVKNATQ